MPNDIKLELKSVSVVILAKTHNPAIVNPDFLKKNGIVEEDWEMAANYPPLSSPMLASISFKNGVQWQVTPDNCTVREKVEDNFKESYLAHECAKKYIGVLEHIPYTAIGQNWHLSVKPAERDMQTWLKTHFLKPGDWQSDTEPINFAFGISSPPSRPLCSFSLNAQQSILDCNFHSDVSSARNKVDALCKTLSEFKKNQEFLKGALKKYFKEDLS